MLYSPSMLLVVLAALVVFPVMKLMTKSELLELLIGFLEVALILLPMLLPVVLPMLLLMLVLVVLILGSLVLLNVAPVVVLVVELEGWLEALVVVVVEMLDGVASGILSMLDVVLKTLSIVVPTESEVLVVGETLVGVLLDMDLVVLPAEPAVWLVLVLVRNM